MGDSPRLEALRRRVLADPASVAFAALAEEYRRAGRFDAAIETARAGLERHSAYASARVTLGRALFESGDHEAARLELEQALAAAPENLAGLRALVDLYRSTGAAERARELAKRGAALAPQDRDWRGLLDALEEERRAGPPNIIPFHPNGRSAPATDDEPPSAQPPMPPLANGDASVTPPVLLPPAGDAGQTEPARAPREDAVNPSVVAAEVPAAEAPAISQPSPLVAVGADGEPLGGFGPPAEAAAAPGAGLEVADVEPEPSSSAPEEPESEALAADVIDVVPEASPIARLDPLAVEFDAPMLLAVGAAIDPLHEAAPEPVTPELSELASRSFIEPDVVAPPVPSTSGAAVEQSALTALAPLERWLDAIVRERRRRESQLS